MTYLELRQEVSRLQEHIETGEKLKAVVISDMPLQPWFDLFLQKFWAEKGRKAELRRIPWEQRREKKYDEEELLIYWPSADVAEEIESEGDKTGIWITPETATDPVKLFYNATVKTKEQRKYPANSRVIDLEQLILRIGLSESLAGKEKRWGDRYSFKLQEIVAHEVVRVYETQHGRRKNGLVSVGRAGGEAVCNDNEAVFNIRKCDL